MPDSAQVAIIRLARLVQRERDYLDRLHEALARQHQEHDTALLDQLNDQYATICAEFVARDRMNALERLREAGHVGGVR